ncbi:MAG: hypothetical protein ACTSPD_09940 [Promethearchaeota archaeon]
MTKELTKELKKKYPYYVYSLGNFRFAFYKKGKRLTLRFEYSKGWE